MKSPLVSILLIAAMSASASALLPGPPAPRFDPEKRQRIQAKKAAVMKDSGGLITQPYAGKVINIKLLQSRVPATFFNEAASTITGATRLPVRIGAVDSIGLEIKVVDDKDSPTLAIFPEVPSATINVAGLLSDSPDENVLKARITKETWRALAYSLGCGYSNFQPCVMRPIFSLSDLDSDSLRTACPEPYGRIVSTARLLQVAPKRTTTYKKACQEGWAPAPTNDVQKAIWDKVHAMPTEPLKIKPETKKVRD